MDREIASVLFSLSMVFLGIFLAFDVPWLGFSITLYGFGRMVWRILFPRRRG